MESRSIDLSVEVPGTPEEVWEAIATGPGLSVWFVPTEVEGDTVTMHHGMLDQTGAVTAREAPGRFAFAVGEGMALEILVEARSGGTCVVRLVNSGFGAGPEADAQFEGSVRGWERCLAILRLYLTHFACRPHARVDAAARTSGTPAEAFAALRAAEGAPAFAGTVELETDTSLVSLLDEPAPGIGMLAVGGPGDELYAVVALSLFGDEAAAVAARVRPEWEAWLERTSTAAG